MPTVPSVLSLSFGYPTDAHPGRMLFTHEQAKALMRLGAIVTVVDVGGTERPDGYFETREGVSVLRLPFPRRLRTDPRQVLGPLVRSLTTLRRRLPGPTDLLLLSFLEHRYLPLLPALPEHRRLGISVHGVDGMLGDHPAHVRWLRRKLAARADHLFAVSQASADVLRPHITGSERLHVVPNGVDRAKLEPLAQVAQTEARNKLGWTDDGLPWVLSVANLVPRKGIDVVIRALAHLRRRGTEARLRIVGRGSERARLGDLVKDLGLGDRVVFDDRGLDDTELGLCFRACDVFGLASRTHHRPPAMEGFGVVYAEAAYLGRPAIGGQSGGVPEVIEHGVTGYLVDPESPTEIETYADALGSLLENASLREAMGRRARDRARARFDWGANARSVLQLSGG